MRACEGLWTFGLPPLCGLVQIQCMVGLAATVEVVGEAGWGGAFGYGTAAGAGGRQLNAECGRLVL